MYILELNYFFWFIVLSFFKAPMCLAYVGGELISDIISST